MNAKEELIRQIKSVDRSRQYVFVSYSKKDADIVYPIVIALQKNGVNLWIDKELEGTAGTAWNEKAFEAMSDSDCVKLLFFMSVHSFMSIPVCAELEYTRHEAVVVNQDKYMDIVPISIADSLNLGTVLDQCKALEESNAEIGEDGLRIFEEGCPEAIQKKVLRASSKRKALLNKVFSDCFGGNREITVVSGNNLESIMKNIPRDAILCEADAAEELVVDAEEEADTSEKDSAASARQLVFHIFGERMEGNQSDFMILAIGRLLKAHPDAIEAATQQFNCLSNVDYENEDVADMPSYFRVCHTAQIAGHQVCIGTSYGLKEKLRLVARIMHFVGENREAVRVEGFELPQIKTKSTDAAQAPTSGRGNEETYTVFGKQYTGNQTQMMWDVFAELADRYPEKIPGLTALTSVKETGKVTNAQTSEAYPTYFRIAKEFQVGGVAYYVGTAYGRKDKLVQIRKMLELCGAPADAFGTEGESVPVAPVKATKKKAYNI